MKEIILVRHASSEKAAEGKDMLRKLLPKGWEEARNVAFLLSKAQKRIDLIITSNAVRAVETGDAFQSAAYKNTTRIVEKTLFSGGKQEYLAVIKALEDTNNTVLLIAHNPVLEEVVAYFCGCSISKVDFPKASVYAFKFDCDHWKDVGSEHSILTLFIKRSHIQKLVEKVENQVQ